MFLSNGGTNIATPINSAVGIGETKVLQANLASNLNATTFVSGNSNTVLDTAGNSNWQFYVAPSTSVASITSSSASSEWTGGSLLSYLEDNYVLYYNFDTTLVSGSNVYNTGSKSYDATLVNATVVTTSPSPSVFGTDRGYLVCTAANYLQINGTYRTGLTGTSIATWINVSGAGGDIFKSSDGTQSSIQLYVSGGTSIVLTVSNNSGDGFYSSTLYTNAAVNNGSWHHVVLIFTPVFTLSTPFTNSSGNSGLAGGVARWQLFFDGVSVFDNTWGNINAKYPDYIVRGTNKIGPITALIDDFRVYDMALTTAQVSALYNGPPPTPTLKHVASGATWMSKPAIAVDSTETNYTIKSNEVALTPGTNSTYAVWTAPKTTNIKVDVSFADYHSRNVGVGFQMFKINADNTFGSVIYPRTVTSTALTNAAPNNYLSVPSRTVSVATGDKIYLRIDANGNTTSASSVLSTNIYVDPNQDLKQPNLLQAHLGNNMAATTFVSGNANVVADTRGTGNWKFYVAGGNSIASITGASNSTEWTGGSLLTYVGASASPPPTDYSLYYTFNTNKVSGTTITDSVSNATGTLVGATITTTSPSPAPGTGYLSIVNTFSPSPVTTNHASLTSITFPTGGMTLSCWIKPRTANAAHIISLNTGASNNIILVNGLNNLTGIVVKGGAIGTYSNASSTGNLNIIGIWNHIVWTLSTANIYQFYVNGVLTNTHSGATYYYPNNVTTTASYIGRSIYGDAYYDGDFDDFRIYNRILTSDEAYSVFMAGAQSKFNDSATGVTWMPTPAVPVNSSETDYTVKSNEIALTPGTNSTFAVWTATKFTNLKIDVSFADYHSRSAGVGFQMFKIKSDNTFDSVLFPRTVTSTALTNAAPNNYLPVPSVSTSVSAGDKIYLRVDANGNTTAASSVLATTIFTDAISVAPNPVENRLLQAHLGNNLNATSFVSGNANTVLDTLGTSNWQFYAASSTSVAAITSASASTEWTGGSLLSYDLGNPLISSYSFDTTTQSGNTIKNTTTNAYDLTLINGATIGTVNPSPYSSLNSGYLTLNMSAGQYATSTTPVSFSRPFTISVWVRYTGTYPTITGSVRPTLIEIGDANKNSIMITAADFSTTNLGLVLLFTGGVYAGGFSYRPTSGNATVWNHFVFTFNSVDNTVTSYVNGVLSESQTSITWNAPASLTYLNFGKTEIPTETNPNTGSWTPCIDKFQIFKISLSASQVSSLYNNTFVAVDNPTLKNTVAGVIWKPFPATVVDDTETSYTIKSNEVALTPGTNSTFAVWTAPKSTNIRVDVSFADYHSRNVGVGFQMFKINADNTFGSVIFPRTVTSTALTNAAPNNYLSVPSKTISVATGDKLYYRVDANGNTTAASSVLATTIYIDPNQDLKQYNVLQANLGNNMAAATLVSGNANVVADTRGTGNWKFYVAGGNSIASVTGSSNSTEWTGGSLITYVGASAPPPTDFSMNFTFNTDKVSGTTITDSSVANYSGTLVGVGATIATTSPSPAPGSGYLSIVNTYSPSPITSNHFALPSITPPVGGMTLSFWLNPRENRDSYIIQIGNGQFNNNIIFFLGGVNLYGIVIKGGTQGPTVSVSPSNNINVTDGTWKHVVWTLNPTNEYKFYLNGSLSNTLTGATYYYPNNVTTTQNYIGRSSYAVPYYNGDFDDFRIYNRILTSDEAYSVFMAGAQSKFNDSATGVTWMPTPAVPVNSSETSYTVKSNEVALRPGTNSTFAVWTATKSTNIKVDVSFADYHSRSSAGVGFQMFKIKSDNTFDSVLFPRTVTSAALTNAAPNNYLSVPSVTTSMNNGDKIYIRVDANGNTTAASSVLATAIYTDAVSLTTNPAETRTLQANLASNLNATSFVVGNTNTVLDTLGTSNWNFYVAPSTSVAAITSSSASSEWAGGTLLSYDLGNPLISSYSFDTTTQSGNTIKNTTTNAYDLTLINGATIGTVNPSPYSSLNSGYLTLNMSAGQYATSTTPVSFSRPFTISVWVRYTGTYPTITGSVRPTLIEIGDANKNSIYMNATNFSTIGLFMFFTNGVFAGQLYYRPDSGNAAVWNHYVLTFNSSNNTATSYVNGVLYESQTITWTAPASFTYLNFGKTDIPTETNPTTGSWTPCIDKFQIFNISLSASQVTSLYDNTFVAVDNPTLKNAVAGVIWKPIPATVIDDTETSYTVKSNEIALRPGTNSTYAVWTAPKSTNIRVDVSFADYHSRSAGVGFQMFKVNADNTFGSVIFPRTVTSTALTNAAPTNYLSVPSRSLSVATGDKIYYRVDANGNTVAASSVISTNIYAYSGSWN